MKEKYFCNLNYTLANEDCSLECGVLPQHTQKILTIAGSGSRVTPLLAHSPKEVYCVDLSSEQLYLTELRIESIRALSHQEFLQFWGYPPRETTSSKERQALFLKIALSEKAKKYWENFFQQSSWQSPLYVGNWEKFMRKITSYIEKLMSSRVKNYFETGRPLPWLRWNLILLLVANSTFFNAFLYKGRHPIKNIKISYFKYYAQMFQRMFDFNAPKENFMLQMTLLGKITYPEAVLLEGQASWFERIKQGLQEAKIHYINDNFLNAAKEYGPFDFISLSDVPSYLSGEIEQKYRQMLCSALNHQGRLVERFYFRVPEAQMPEKLQEMNSHFEKLIQTEKTQIYQIKIWERS